MRFLLLASALVMASAFSPAALQGLHHGSRRSGSRIAVSMKGVRVEPDVDAVGKALCDILAAEADKAIKDRGHFSFSIPGGSVLKMLSGMDAGRVDWSKSTMAYVNHRCVPLDDESSTHFKAQKLFLKTWQDKGLQVITLTGSNDANKEADSYETALKGLSKDVLPRDAEGMPVFDLSLIGVGMDGHVGSLYPNSANVAETRRAVVPVVKSSSSSISLSLPVMLASKSAVIACAGKDAKSPLGKAEAMVRGLEGAETPASFPASAFRDTATWLLDADTACLLKKK